MTSPSSNPFLDAAADDGGSSKQAAPESSKWFNFKPVNPFAFSFTGQSKPGNAELAVEEDEETGNSKASSSQKGQKVAKLAQLSKEQELKRREEELAKREAQLHEQQRLNNPRIPNFPVCWPLMHHNIKIDIPPASKVTMRWMFRSWVFSMITLAVNAAGCFSIMIAHPQGNTTGAKDFGISIMYFIGIIIASFYLWYRPVYNAYMKDSSMLFYFFFFFNGWHVLFLFYMALGVPSSGSAGIINTISVVTDSKVISGIICAVSSSCWLAAGLLSLYLYRRTHYYYRVKGLTADDAKREAMKGVAGSGLMQGAAQTYIKSNTGFF
ncbi:hypothetical protein HDU97_000808 [Phlyctochytrium planicorne]|nr:hypothetical protein HDU97_000808 [Phlyctochytrium planicorne]